MRWGNSGKLYLLNAIRCAGSALAGLKVRRTCVGPAAGLKELERIKLTQPPAQAQLFTTRDT